MKAERLAEIKAAAEKHAGKGSKCVAMLLECVTEIERLQKPKRRTLIRSAAINPTLEQVKQLAQLRGWPDGQAEKFFAHYEAIGWVYGKHRHPIKSLTALMNTWSLREKKPDAKPKRDYGIG